ncbi:hypothetical protein DHW03_13960 [Pedobacter yonginense]|uniref:PD-(D/E)XK motif protein n=1 Tax=Pedobacter yonginense TaxID=651869 RepID=A0A317EL50_9SPHI|nr:PD-(D/E)XK motif protein [Pedobacter yonginense]PWS27105.1 hypothetical protein DHW03_13960 [Pedobacter yonginense]
MSLLALFNTLAIPKCSDLELIESEIIPDSPDFRIGKNELGLPILLLKIEGEASKSIKKNLKLKNLIILHDLKCRVLKGKKEKFDYFSAIKFLSSDLVLQEFFLKMSERLILSLSESSNASELINQLDKFAELFRAMSDAPTKSIQGLWAELLLISKCEKSDVLIDYWHNNPLEKFDFNSGDEKIEVKSSSNFERIHFFSAEQLTPDENEQVIVASIFVRQSSNGLNILQLLEKIIMKLNNGARYSDKLNSIVFHTLGNSIEQAFTLKFDYELAVNSIKFYHHSQIKKISATSIPQEVSEVKYKSDLSSIREMKNEDFIKGKILMNCLTN